MINQILPLEPKDREQVRALVVQEWGAEFIIVHQELFYPHTLPGFKAVENETLTGLITYQIRNSTCEIITLNSFREREGLGTALVQTVEATARLKGCESCRLVTTNNNMYALGFYQKRGFSIIQIDRGAVDQARKRKPSLPLFDEHGVLIRDEITLEKLLI